MIGQRLPWHASFGTIPGPLQINNSNEWGHCFYSFHPGGANFCMADGSVRQIPANIEPKVFRAMCTIHGAETVDLQQATPFNLEEWK